MGQELALLNKLQLPSGIRKLCFHGYPGQQFASWVMKQNDSSVSLEGEINHLDSPCYSFLAHMKLVDFPNLKHLSGLVNLPSLNNLELDNFFVLETVFVLHSKNYICRRCLTCPSFQ